MKKQILTLGTRIIVDSVIYEIYSIRVDGKFYASAVNGNADDYITGYTDRRYKILK
jgi:hypothetical protein